VRKRKPGVKVTDDELTTTLCTILDDAGVGVYRADGSAYTAGEVGIFYGPVGTSPDRGVGVTLYHKDEDDLANGLQGDRRVQFRVRGAPGVRNGANVLAQAVEDALNGLSRTAGLFLVKRVQMAQLGTDGNNRSERADSYQITFDLPEA